MLKAKKMLMITMISMTMAFAGNAAAYAEESVEIATEESADYEASATITLGESGRNKDTDTNTDDGEYTESAEIAAQEEAADHFADSTDSVSTGSTPTGSTSADNASADSISADIDSLTEETEDDGLTSLGHFLTTAYCPCAKCSEGFGRKTSTGKIAKANHTIAVDPRVIPYGSKVMINGTVYTAEDRGGGVKGNHIDIFYDTHAQTRQYGARKVEVFLLG